MHSPADVQWPRDKVDGRWSMVDGRYAQITSGNSLKGLLGAILKL